MNKAGTICQDLAKQVFQVHGAVGPSSFGSDCAGLDNVQNLSHFQD